METGGVPVLRSRLFGALRSESGFTLIELLAVAVILIILALMALPVYAEVTDKARNAKSQEDLRVIEQGLEAYQAQHSHYPINLNTLVTDGFLKPSALESPWSSPKNRVYYYYAVDRAGEDKATNFIIGDAGADASCGGEHPTPPCGNDPTDQAWVSLTVPEGLTNIRKSR